MIVCLDVDYRASEVIAACVGFERWDSPVAAFQRVERVGGAPAPYKPGSFYLRELPHLLRILELAPVAPSVVVVDGYVSLAPGRPGLGERLFHALHDKVPVVGVAKTAFRGATHALAVKRGASDKPLFVTAIGIDPRTAAKSVASMHGAHRVPTMLRQVDRACRDF